MADEQAKRAAIYLRVSTDEQVEGTSLRTQMSRCEHYIASNSWSVAGVYTDDGVSGALRSRPQLDRLMGDVHVGLVDVVVVAKLDRFGRSVRHLSALLGELDDLGVPFVSVAENIDGTTPAGRLQRTLLSSFAEFERDRITERMNEGVTAVLSDGYWPGGAAPFGYRRVPEGRHVRLQIDPAEQAVILHAVACVVDRRMSARQTADELNALQLPPRRSARWTGQRLRGQLLTSIGLSGRWTYRRSSRRGKPGRDPDGRYGPSVTIAIPAILTPERHQALNAALAETSTGAGATKRKHTYLLSRRITSPCGHPMHGYTNGSKKSAYKCAQSWPWVPAEQRCSCRLVPAAVIETQVWAEIVNILADPDKLLAGARRALELTGTASTIDGDDLRALNGRIERLEHAAGEQVAQLLASGVDPAVAGHAASTLTADLETLRQRQRTLSQWAAANAEDVSRAERLQDLAAEASQLLVHPSPETKGQIVDTLDVRVHVTGYSPCVACGASGWEPREPDEQGKRPPGLAGIVPCHVCHRTRRTVHWTLTGQIPDSLLSVPPTHNAGCWPFEVIVGEAAG